MGGIKGQRILRVVKILCIILITLWWVHLIIHLSKPNECKALRIMQTVDFTWLWYVNVGSLIVTIIILARNANNGGGYVCVGTKDRYIYTFLSILLWTWIHGKSLYLSLNFAVNLKLFLKNKILLKIVLLINKKHQ